MRPAQPVTASTPAPRRLPAAAPASSRPLVHAGVLLGVLLAEYALLSALFDAQSLLARAGWWSGAGYLGTLAPLAVIAATAALLLEGRKLRDELLDLEGELRGHEVALPLGLHLFAFAGLLAATWRCFSPDLPPPDLVWLLVWATAAAGTVGAAVAAAFPPRAALLFVRRGGRALLVGVGVGALGWGAALLAEGLWSPLGDPTLYAVERLLALHPGEVLRHPTRPVIGLEGFYVSVAPVCSGYQGMGLMAVFVGAFLVWQRRTLRFPLALSLLPLAIALSWLANVLRITALILLGAHVSPELALGGFHAKAGWVLFCALALGIVAVARRSTLLCRAPEPERPVIRAPETWNPAAAFLTPLLALIALALTTGMFVGEGIDPLYGLRLVAALGALWVFRDDLARALGGLRAAWSWSACGVGVLVFVVWMAPEVARPLGASDVYPRGLSELSPASEAGWLLLRALGLVLVVPVVEELAFRGFLLRWLTRPSDFTAVPLQGFSWAALAGSSLAFGLLHEKWAVGIVAGVLYGLLLRRRGRLGDAVIAHAVTNALLGIAVLATGRWSLL